MFADFFLRSSFKLTAIFLFVTALMRLRAVHKKENMGKGAVVDGLWQNEAKRLQGKSEYRGNKESFCLVSYCKKQ